MKHLKLPAPKTVKITTACQACRRPPEQDREIELTLLSYIEPLLDDPSFLKTPKQVRANMKIRDALKSHDGTPDTYLSLEDDWYSALMAVYNAPSFSYHPNVAEAAAAPGSFMDCIENPVDAIPEEPEEPEEASPEEPSE